MSAQKNGPSLISNQQIQDQLQKILETKEFAVSGIMSRFLTYIVKETISQRSDSIKEYNIGVEVLNKQPLYKTGLSGVVRVHARRLRNALDRYYSTQGQNDKLIISIPKGRYIPSFEYQRTGDLKTSAETNIEIEEKVKLAVLPFSFHGKDEHVAELSENLVLLLNTVLVMRKNVDILSRYTIERIVSRRYSLKRMALDYGLRYVLTGNIHCNGSKVRVYTQLINVNSENQVWSQAYTLSHKDEQLVGLEDKIVFQLMKDLHVVDSIFEGSARSGDIKIGTNLNDNKVYYLSSYAVNQHAQIKKSRRI